MIELLREIVNKPAAQLTANDRKTIRKAASEAGIKLPRTRDCESCWIDCAVLCYTALRARYNAPTRLREGVDILFNGERVCEATATEVRLQRWIKAGLPLCYVRND